MLLEDSATRVELRPVGHQFAVAVGDPWDDNWLNVDGRVTTPEGDFSFRDPCLTTGEAGEIAGWLRRVAAGVVPVTGPGEEGEPWPDLWFTEPLLGFGLAGRNGDGTLTVRVHLSAEATPPWRRDEYTGEVLGDIYGYALDLRTDAAALLRAADAWERALTAFPSR
ncbi:WapI family immunity protein [Streptomyces sp. CO7]